MKTGWKKKTRKERIEDVSRTCCKLTWYESASAWGHLTVQLENLSDPSAKPCPKFDDLLMSILRAKVSAEKNP